MDESNALQAFIHRLEVGSWAVGVRFLLVAVCALVLAIFFLASFRGLSSPAGMDQAQIARELARGNGFSTKCLRPLAIAQFHARKAPFPSGNFPDVYHAPLNPFINSLFLKLRRNSLEMAPKEQLFHLDTFIAEIAICFFLLSAGINYLTARRLFGPHLALLGTGLLLLCNTFWQFALSGLPQMLMLCLFSACLYVEARAQGRRDGTAAGWTAAAGALFGLLALTHGLTIWILAGALAYKALLKRWRDAPSPVCRFQRRLRAMAGA